MINLSLSDSRCLFGKLIKAGRTRHEFRCELRLRVALLARWTGFRPSDASSDPSFEYGTRSIFHTRSYQRANQKGA